MLQFLVKFVDSDLSHLPNDEHKYCFLKLIYLIILRHYLIIFKKYKLDILSKIKLLIV